MPDKIIAIIMHPGKRPIQTAIPNTLEALQDLVGGYIETVSMSNCRVLIVNEEGLLKNLPVNRVVLVGRRPLTLVGTVVMVRAKGDGFVSVHGGDLEWIESQSMVVVGEASK